MPPSKSSPTITTDAPLLGLPGVGPKTAERLGAVGLERLSDLLLFAPRRYDDAGALRPFATLQAGERAYVEGTITRASVKRFFRRATLEVVIEDEAHGNVLLRWFRHRGDVPARYVVGARVRAAGKVRIAQRGREMIQPTCDVAEEGARERSLSPRYAPIEGVSSAAIGKLVALACSVQIDDFPVPSLPDLVTAARELHALPPLPEGEARQALVEGRSRGHERLAFEALLVLRLSARDEGGRAPVLSGSTSRLVQSLPYAPTGTQRRAIDEIAAALASTRPMRRLLTGDVGTGKTLVAACAIEACVGSGQRAAFLAPTALLAEQQLGALSSILRDRRVALLHSGTPAKERTRLLAALADPHGPVDVIVGTHALFEERVQLAGLGLVVIDEQQRFGVRQRAALTSATVHQLSLSATPIPRTLALALRGLVEVSHLSERPLGRAPVATALTTRPKALRAVRDELERGGLVYWICPTIDSIDSRGVREVERWLGTKVHVPVHLCHGQQPVSERAEQLRSFRELGGVLVATTVVEVGLDIPEATLMVVESPERLGLAQLHQLRGRVGRGDRSGRCLLVADAKTPRLALLVESQDGQAIAEADLQLRGMGELGGEEQSGFPSLPPLPADVLESLARKAEEVAARITLEDPALRAPGHQRLARALARRRDGYDSA
ncbi:MAG: helicase-related protein [Polyangia bacterium]